MTMGICSKEKHYKCFPRNAHFPFVFRPFGGKLNLVAFNYHGRVGNKRCAHPIELIGLENGVAIPICPVHVVPEQCNAEGVLEHVGRVEDDPRTRSKKKRVTPEDTKLGMKEAISIPNKPKANLVAGAKL